MYARLPGMLGLLALIALACGGGDEGAPVEAVPIAGNYQVSGVTVNTTSGQQREISGTVTLFENGSSYTAAFQLNTTYPGAAEALPAQVLGTGEGTIDGRTLVGSAQTQLVMATVPGVDPGFAYIPRQVSTRIVSTSITQIADDGSLTIELENSPAEGAQYAPTRTTLRGSRVSAVGVGGGRR